MKKKLACILVVLLTMALFVMPAMAADYNTAGDGAHTYFGVTTSTTNPTQINFTVPLYVTSVVVSNSANVVVPSNYAITNTGNTAASSAICVTSIVCNQDAGASWSLTAAAPTGANGLKFSVGNYVMAAGKTYDVKTETTGVFYNTGTPTNFKPITSQFKSATNNKVDIPLVGTVASMSRTDSTVTSDAFKLVYTITACDANGAPIKSGYVGDDSTATGAGYLAAPIY
ncbi:MAG: hypothetical protein RRZ24_09635 [Clostridia bacterium]